MLVLQPISVDRMQALILNYSTVVNTGSIIILHTCSILSCNIQPAAKCGYPQLQPLSRPSNFVMSVGPTFPITEGAFINFSCPHNYILSGPNSTVCTDYGQWNPNPEGIGCVKLKGSRQGYQLQLLQYN